MKKILFSLLCTLSSLNAMYHKSDPLNNMKNLRLLKNPVQQSSNDFGKMSERDIQKQYIDDLKYYQYQEPSQDTAVQRRLHSSLLNYPQLVSNLVILDGSSILHLATSKNDLNLMDKAIKAGADVSAEDDFNICVLSMATIGLHLPAAQKLIDAGCTVKKNILTRVNRANSTLKYHDSVEQTYASQIAIMTLLLQHGADINATGVPYKRPAIFKFVKEDHVVATKFLLERHAKLDITDENNQTIFDITKSDEMRNLLQQYQTNNDKN